MSTCNQALWCQRPTYGILISLLLVFGISSLAIRANANGLDLTHEIDHSHTSNQRHLLVADDLSTPAVLAREGKLLGLREANAALQQAADRATKNVPAVISGGGDGGLWTGPKLVDAFVASLSMILVSEIGDETFIIAALMAMRHPRSIVLAGALSALLIMTILSTGLGLIVPSLISRKATNRAATVLYIFFGLRLLYIAWTSDPKESTVQKEMEEVEEKLEGDEKGNNKGRFRAVRRFFARFLTPIFLEAFILTFLAEWGDRSQIATIALASHKNALGVTVGAALGHVVCTSFAVVGGRLLALRISQRTVATVGGCLFLAFAVHSYFSPLE